MEQPTAAPAPMPPTIEVDGVSKWYGDKVAVSDLTFTVGPGVTALLGPNGAGKSTTLKMLTGQLRPSQGTVRVLGSPVIDNPSLYRRIGLVPEQEELYPFLSALQFVELAAGLHHVPRARDAARGALQIVDLLDAQHRKLGGFSKGMRQRVKIAQALVHEPQVLFLDEPLAGTDPRQRLALMEVFGKLGEEGRTVLISSHILTEVERMSTSVLVIARGKLAAEGNFHQIRALMHDHPRRVRIKSDDCRALAAELVRLSGTRSVEIDKDSLVVETTTALELYHGLPRAAQQTGVRLYEISALDEDLESVFRYLVER